MWVNPVLFFFTGLYKKRQRFRQHTKRSHNTLFIRERSRKSQRRPKRGLHPMCVCVYVCPYLYLCIDIHIDIYIHIHVDKCVSG